MTVLFPVLIRRAAAEAERRLRAGAGLLAAIAGEPDRTEREDLRRLLDQEARIHRLEERLDEQDRDLRGVRTDLDSLIAQLNDRLLPRIDERMDETERDLTSLATGLVRAGREAAAQRSGLSTVENRLADLRGKLTRLEQRAGLWRDLQANMARMGDDIDALRFRRPLPGRRTRHDRRPGLPPRHRHRRLTQAHRRGPEAKHIQPRRPTGFLVGQLRRRHVPSGISLRPASGVFRGCGRMRT
jgi:DNA repair exonuclease SbcCD ATPase subunit